MRTEELKSEIRKLDISEKLILIEEVWDDIAKSNEELPLPEWHKIELSKRLEAYDQGENDIKASGSEKTVLKELESLRKPRHDF